MQDRLNTAMKRAKITDLNKAGNEESTRNLKQDYEGKLSKVEESLERCFNSTVGLNFVCPKICK